MIIEPAICTYDATQLTMPTVFTGPAGPSVGT